MDTKLIYKTKSVCPHCLRTVYADIVERADGIYMDKACPEHGQFSTLIWAGSEREYLRWLDFGCIDISTLPRTEEAVERALAGAAFTDCACQKPASAAS